MIDSDTLVKWGVPRLRSVLPAAMKAANVALSRGTDKEAVQALFERLTRSEKPQNEPMGELAGLFMPLAKLLKLTEDIKNRLL